MVTTAVAEIKIADCRASPARHATLRHLRMALRLRWTGTAKCSAASASRSTAVKTGSYAFGSPARPGSSDFMASASAA